MADTPPDTTSPDPDARPRRRRRRWWLVALGVVLVWAVAAAIVGVQAKGHTDEGRRAFDDVAPVATGSLTGLVDALSDPQPEGMDQPIPERLREAADEFAAARDALGSPVFAPFLVLPVLGRQLRSARSLSEVAAEVAAASSDAYDELTELLDAPSESPAARLEAVRGAAGVLREAQDRIEGLDLGPSEALVGRLGDARVDLETEYERVSQTLDMAIDAVVGLDSFLTGPTRYLLLASNNAEMRAGSGMFLQVGVLTVADGRFTVEDLQPTRNLDLETDGAQLDPDVEANWGALEPDQEWRNLNVTPRFEESARMATEMWSTFQPPVDGAISIDVAGLQALLEVVGPVDVDGRSISADDVVDYLLKDQYLEFPDQVEAREDQVEKVARAALEAFNDRDSSPTDLIGSLQKAGRDRHIMLWSTREVEQVAWTAVHAAGTVPEDAMLLAVLNRGGNKLDPYLDIDADISFEEADDGTRVRIGVNLTNTTPEELPRYVQGPYPGLGLEAGGYQGIVQLTIPGSAEQIAMTGGEPAVNGNDGPTKVIGTQLRIDRGQTGHVDFEFVLPEGVDAIRLLPSARLPPTTWSSGDITRRDGRPRIIRIS